MKNNKSKKTKVIGYQRVLYVSSCCKAKIKMNPIEWSSPHHVKTWQAWCLKCEKPCKLEKKDD